MGLSIKTKALLFLCPVIVLMSVINTVTAIRTEQRLLRDEIIKRGGILVTIAVKNAELPLLSQNREQVKNAAVFLKDIQLVPFVTFFTAEFEPIVHEGIPVDFDTVNNEGVSALGNQDEDIFSQKTFSVHEHGDYFEFYGPVFTEKPADDIAIFDEADQLDSQREHLGWVLIGLSKDVMNQTAKTMTINGALICVLLVGVAIALVNLFLNLILKPLKAFSGAVKNLREGEYQQVPQIDSSDEIGQLSTEFNKMISTIKDREERLIESQQRIRELFERVEHAIFRMNNDFKIMESNRKLREICQPGVNFLSLLAEEDKVTFMEAAVAGNFVGEEIEIHPENSTSHVILLSVYPQLGTDGSISGFDGHFVDISETKTLEEALHQTQKLESLGLLAGGVAHDFNNILTTILGYSELALQDMEKNDPLRGSIEEILAAGDRAAGLTRQLLAFSRKQVLELMVIDLNTLINNMAKMLGRLIGEDVEMSLKLSSILGNIKADPGQIEQIIMNLAVNARDAMPDGGELIFETDFIELDEEYCKVHADVKPGHYVVLSVSDTGSGLTQEVKEKMFEPFFTTKEKGAGTGLGLSTVYGIVKQMKGHIFVYSEPGLGTTFKIYFPEEQDTAGGKDIGVRLGMMTGTETLLVVDDEASIRRIVADTLRPLGYQVYEAYSGENALEVSQAIEGVIHLLLTDVIMPGMTGRELAESLVKLRPETKVLYMSGYTDDIIAHKGILRPNVNFVNKPILPSLLTQKIRGVLDAPPKDREATDVTPPTS